MQREFGRANALLDLAVTSINGAGVHGQTTYDVTGHVNTKLAGALVGGFAGVDATADQTTWGLGLEGQTNLGRDNSLYAQGGYARTDGFGKADTWGVRGELRHFYADNVKVQASAGYSNNQLGHLRYDVWNVGVQGEYQFAAKPWSMFAAFDHTDAGNTVKSDTFRIGGRYTFGGATLRARDALGADFGSLGRLISGVIVGTAPMQKVAQSDQPDTLASLLVALANGKGGSNGPGGNAGPPNPPKCC